LDAVFFFEAAAVFVFAARFGTAAVATASACTDSSVGDACCLSASVTVMWHVRLRILATRPRARARQRFMTGPPSTNVVLTYSRSSAMP
jgi:hypothetical protein